ncbi:FAD-binding domain-containing protein [Aegicerativicinus sediminis]|uniref:FAD-binding domain-containing protein n=1 Tax=Aegicerativicinus sediminis TaxID=2893202 RepID=UPI001E2A2682|nr:FAD-binding domain-containing protein [Aegicerativicinus sediminis]
MYEFLTGLGQPWNVIEKLVQELAWREYWQLVWLNKGDAINSDLKNVQQPISNHLIPKNVVDANTHIQVVDEAIKELYDTGYMHNHMRMYVASICCNIAQSHWHQPSKWMYYHLLDGDIASNQLSWQWVAGTFSNKKYYANQENINKYFNSTQKNTFLDISYEEFENLEIPKTLLDTILIALHTKLPKVDKPNLFKNKKTLIYNYYNLDAEWHKHEDFQRVLLLEPSIFKANPVSLKCIDFTLSLAKNIPDLKIFVGEFTQLAEEVSIKDIIYKEHPLNTHYIGIEEEREWMTNVRGYFSSFHSFWKKCKKELKN